MSRGILGRKVGMTQIYNEAGKIVPVTVIQAGPCHVLQLRTVQRDGYEAVQFGFDDKPRRLARRSERGHVAKLNSKRSRNRTAAGVEAPEKADCEPQRFIREIRGVAGELEVGGQVVLADLFETDDERAERVKAEDEARSKAKKGQPVKLPHVNDKVKAIDVTATSKGRGFAGVMKRHNYSGQRATHGVKKVHRHAGGTGMSASPSRVFKGKRMAGQYGAVQVTTRNLKIVRIDEENNLLVVRGAVPGPNGGYVVIRESNKVG